MADPTSTGGEQARSGLADAHGDALRATRRVVAGISPGQMGDPTPCAEWDVRALLNHVIAGNWWAAELADGKTIEDVGDRLDGDVVHDDPLGEYDRSAEAADRVFRRPGAMDAPCAVSYGPVPGEVYCGHRLTDVAVHGWDLATATGQESPLTPGLVAAVWSVLEPQLPMLAASGMFGDPHDPGPDADPTARLLAVLGRA